MKNYFRTFAQRKRLMRRRSQTEHNKPFLLQAIAQLTQRTEECSSIEVAASIMDNFTEHDVRRIGRLLAGCKVEGLVTNRKLYRLSLWKLTDAGREYLKEKKTSHPKLKKGIA